MYKSPKSINNTIPKPLIIIICLLFFITLAIADDTVPTETHQHSYPHCGKAHALKHRILAQKQVAELKNEYESMVAAGMRELSTDTDLLHCGLELEITSFSPDTIAGDCTLTVESKSMGLTEFTFRLREQYDITSASIGGTPVIITDLSTTSRSAALDRAYDTGEIFALNIVYDGVAESRGLGSIEFDTHGGTDVVSTLSQPYYAYTWFPIKDGDFAEPGDMGDKFLLDFSIIAPDTMVTASNGVLDGIDTLSGNRERYRWYSDYPIAPYLVCFSSTNYNTYEQYYSPIGGGSMPVLVYIYPEHDSTSNRNAWFKCIDMMYTLRNMFGEYPFVNEKYGIYEFEFGGGMEHQTFTGQTGFGEALTVHELGHQWWGDMITCKTWNHIWLNEGFASYTEALWAEFKPGSSGLPALKSTMAAMRYTGAGSVYVDDTELDNVYNILNVDTSYDKAAWVVHMLRHVLGDTNFFDALIQYRTDFLYGAATTEDFQGVCELYYPGGDLDWFFQEWIYGEYVPSYEWGWDTTTINGKHYLMVSVDQVQNSSIQRFTMPIDIVADSTTHVIYNDTDEEYFVIPTSSVPSTVAFDPDIWILMNGKRELTYNPGPPKIVETDPVPGTVRDVRTGIDTVTVTFHTEVETDPADFILEGLITGNKTFTISSTSLVNPVILELDTPLVADQYTLTVIPTLTASDSSQVLDGEIDDPFDPASFPSGDGVQGGFATIKFTVVAPVIPAVSLWWNIAGCFLILFAAGSYLLLNVRGIR